MVQPTKECIVQKVVADDDGLAPQIGKRVGWGECFVKVAEMCGLMVVEF
jgi:hypothetical protein